MASHKKMKKHLIIGVILCGLLISLPFIWTKFTVGEGPLISKPPTLDNTGLKAYGLGLFSKLDAIYCIAIAFAVSLLTIGFASVWRAIFSRGPFEYGLRKFTYLGDRQI